MAVQNQLTRCGSRRSVNAFPSPEHNNEAVLAAIHSSAGTLCTRVGHWRRRPPGYLAVFSTFARLRPIGLAPPQALLIGAIARGVLIPILTCSSHVGVRPRAVGEGVKLSGGVRREIIVDTHLLWAIREQDTKRTRVLIQEKCPQRDHGVADCRFSGHIGIKARYRPHDRSAQSHSTPRDGACRAEGARATCWLTWPLRSRILTPICHAWLFLT